MKSTQQTIYRLGIVATIVIAIIVVVACNLGLNPMSGNDGETSPPVVDGPTVVEPQTGVKVLVPTISSRLLSGLDAIYRPPSSGQLSAQALLFATSMSVRVYDWDDGLFPGGDWLEDPGLPETLIDMTVDATTSLGGEPSESGSPSSIEAFLDIDAGTDYSIAVDVYNTNWDGVGPVVSGFSGTEFDIFPGQSTVVPIVALPNDPVTPLLGTPDVLPIVQTAYTYSTDPEEEGRMIMSGVGGEDWMSIDLSGETLTIDSYVRVVADPGGTADAALLIYDEAGIYMFEDQPGLSWGLMPAEYGGEGGTRAALMGPASDGETEFIGYMGIVLLDQTESPPPLTSENATVTIEILDRPQPGTPYTNSVAADMEPDPANFLPIGVGEGAAVTQTLFNNEMTEVHWYSLNDADTPIDTNGIDWTAPDLLNPLPITVTATFDVLDSEHIQGGRYEYDGGEDYFIPAFALLIGDEASPDPPDIYAPKDDPDFVVTENADGSSTVEFTIDVDTTSVGPTTMAAVAVSSRWMGVEYTVSWNAPGIVELIVE